MPAARIDQRELKHLIEVEKLTQHETAKRLGVSISCVERTCKRIGLKTQRTGPRGGSGHPNWQGGYMKSKGYWMVHRPGHPMAKKGGYVSEHRLKMAEHLGRMLLRTEVVHHIDGDPTNNSIENLQLFQTNSEHLRHELAGKTPAHTPAGKEQMRASCQRTAIRRKLKALCDSAHTQMSVLRLKELAQAAQLVFGSPTRHQLQRLLFLSMQEPETAKPARRLS